MNLDIDITKQDRNGSDACLPTYTSVWQHNGSDACHYYASVVTLRDSINISTRQNKDLDIDNTNKIEIDQLYAK